MSPEEYREFLKTVKPGSSPLPKSQLLGKARLPRNGRTYQTDAMNQTEARYAGYLDGMKHTGEVVAWAYEAVKLRLCGLPSLSRRACGQDVLHAGFRRDPG